jgi:hypothetical protein
MNSVDLFLKVPASMSGVASSIIFEGKISHDGVFEGSAGVD